MGVGVWGSRDQPTAPHGALLPRDEDGTSDAEAVDERELESVQATEPERQRACALVIHNTPTAEPQGGDDTAEEQAHRDGDGHRRDVALQLLLPSTKLRAPPLELESVEEPARQSARLGRETTHGDPVAHCPVDGKRSACRHQWVDLGQGPEDPPERQVVDHHEGDQQCSPVVQGAEARRVSRFSHVSHGSSLLVVDCWKTKNRLYPKKNIMSTTRPRRCGRGVPKFRSRIQPQPKHKLGHDDT